MKKKIKRDETSKHKKIKHRHKRARQALVLALREVNRAKLIVQELLSQNLSNLYNSMTTFISNPSENTNEEKQQQRMKDAKEAEKQKIIDMHTNRVKYERFKESKHQLIHWVQVVQSLSIEYQIALTGMMKIDEIDQSKINTGSSEQKKDIVIIATDDETAEDISDSLSIYVSDILDEFYDALENINEEEDNVENDKTKATKLSNRSIFLKEQQLYKQRVAACRRVDDNSNMHDPNTPVRVLTPSDVYEDWIGGHDGDEDDRIKRLIVTVPLQNILEELAIRACNNDGREENVNTNINEDHTSMLGESFLLWSLDATKNEAGDSYGMKIFELEKKGLENDEDETTNQIVEFDLEHCSEDHVLWELLADHVSSSSHTFNGCPLCEATPTTTNSMEFISYSCVQQVAMECIALAMTEKTMKTIKKNPLCYFMDTVTAVESNKIELLNQKTVWNITKEEKEEEERINFRDKNFKKNHRKMTAFDLYSMEKSKEMNNNQLLKSWKRVPKWEKSEWKKKAQMRDYIATAVEEGGECNPTNEAVEDSKRSKKKKKKRVKKQEKRYYG